MIVSIKQLIGSAVIGEHMAIHRKHKVVGDREHRVILWKSI